VTTQVQVEFDIGLAFKARCRERLAPFHSNIRVHIALHIRNARIIVNCQLGDSAIKKALINLKLDTGSILTLVGDLNGQVVFIQGVHGFIIFTCRGSISLFLDECFRSLVDAVGGRAGSGGATGRPGRGA
jgi:hypothetical protein